MAEQEKLLELKEQPRKPTVEDEAAGECKLRLVNRDQLTMAQIDVEHLIGEHHPARGIWEVTKGLDLSKYESAIRTRKGGWDERRGRPSCWLRFGCYVTVSESHRLGLWSGRCSRGRG